MTTEPKRRAVRLTDDRQRDPEPQPSLKATPIGSISREELESRWLGVDTSGNEVFVLDSLSMLADGVQITQTPVPDAVNQGIGRILRGGARRSAQIEVIDYPSQPERRLPNRHPGPIPGTFYINDTPAEEFAGYPPSAPEPLVLSEQHDIQPGFMTQVQVRLLPNGIEESRFRTRGADGVYGPWTTTSMTRRR